MPTSRSWGLFVVFFLALVAIVALSPQPSALSPEPLALRQAQPPPVFHTEANYVRVDVYPTKDGAPVPDLTKDDFEILEDKVPQKVEQFEHILIRPAGPQETRREPNTVGESREALNDPQARAFVLFLDTYHVEVGGSHNIRQPLINALNRTIGQDDLVAVMTPEMSARDLTFARRTGTIEGMLTRYWPWGERERINSVDPIEDQYRACFPGTIRATATCASDAGIAQEMIDRRRERLTLNALRDLVRYLRDVREERTAIITISDGWLQFRPDATLSRPVGCQVPSGPDVAVDPVTGRLTTRPTSSPTGTSPNDCERDRLELANIDDAGKFRQILDEANRANASFYTVDPRGLVVFDTPIVSSDSTGAKAVPMTTPSADRGLLQARLDSLRTMAEATDGLAVLDNNDLAAGLRRVTSDLTSYYLLGYYSSGKLDGKFHAIAVRVKRPGVQVRARRGYLAPTLADANARTAAAAAPAPLTAEEVEANAVEAAVAPLAGFTRELPLRVQLAAGWKPDHTPIVWAVGEIGASEARGDGWQTGGVADVLLSQSGGGTTAEAHATLAAGTRTFRVALAPAQPLTPGAYDVRIRAHGASGSGIPINEVAHVTLAASPAPTGVVLIRRGLSTGNKEIPTADRRFRRNERLRAEVPAPAATTVTARLLDRMGKPLAVPVTAAVRDEADGSRWATAEVMLAPLAPGEYVIELTGAGDARTLVAFQVVQ